MPWFHPIVGVKEKAVSALTENCRHLTSLAGELCIAKPLPSRETFRRSRGEGGTTQLSTIN